ncbi:MAG: murein biosynthesis integral membrane protein MurJ [Microthrixaceae bacterium]
MSNPSDLGTDNSRDDSAEFSDWVDEAAADEPSGAGRSLIGASAVPAVGTMLSRVSGLVRVAALTGALGLTSLADVYNLANTSPNIIYELVIGGVLSSTLVPLFIQAHHDQIQGEGDNSESVMVTVGFVAITLLTVVAVLLAPLINRLFAIPLHGAELAHQLDVGDDFLVLLFPQVFFYGITTMATALLHSRRRFAAPAFAPVLTNIVISVAALGVYLVLKPEPGKSEMSTVYLLGIGTTAGVAAMAVALLPAIRRADVHLRWDFRPRHPAVKAVMRLSGWTIGFAVANQVALLLVLAFARGAGVGAVSAYQYAFIFFQLPYGLIAVSLMTAVLPELSTFASAGDDEGFAAKFREGLSLMLTFMIPAAGAYLLFGRAVIALLLQRGEFDAAATTQTLAMLNGFSIGLPAFAVFLYCIRAFYARRNTRTPFYLNLVENTMNVILVFPLVALIGESGLAAAYSSAYWIAAIGAVIVLSRVVPGLIGSDGAAMGAKVLMVSAAVLAALGLTSIGLPDSLGNIATLTIALIVAVGVLAGSVVVVKPYGFEPIVARANQELRRLPGRKR